MKASDILSFSDLSTRDVEVREWGCTLRVRELGLDEGMKLFALARTDGDGLKLSAEDIAQVVAWGVIDPDTGERVFSDDDVPKLAKKNRKPLMALYTEITSLSGEDAEKN